MAPRLSLKKRSTTVTIAKRTFEVSGLLDEFFQFMRDRHDVHVRRLAGEDIWTDDPILEEYKFTNIFRVFDRNTQFILHEVIPSKGIPCDESDTEVCFRVLLFRMFNRIETWELLTRKLGQLTWRNFDAELYDAVLRSVSAVHGHAYFIPAPKLGGHDNISNHLRLIYLLMSLQLDSHLKEFRHMQDAVEYICLFPGMGKFTGFQLLLDLNMTNIVDFSEDEWAACGPGARDGLKKIFGSHVLPVDSDAIKFLYEHQHDYWTRLGIEPPVRHLTRKGVSVVDLEHSLCEFDKYCRKKHPEISGRRTNMKKRFTPSDLPYTGSLPEKWTQERAIESDEFRPAAIDEKDGVPLYEVSHIIAQSAGGKRFLVRWKNWPPEDDSWEPASNLTDYGAGGVLDTWQAKLHAIRDTADAITKGMQLNQKRSKRVREQDVASSRREGKRIKR